jgi:hypothetical protein
MGFSRCLQEKEAKIRRHQQEAEDMMAPLIQAGSRRSRT